MYARMQEISEHVENFRMSPAVRENPQMLADARAELYRGQCNCAYWHGAFGGLYLPHLRNAVYKHLIKAENALLAGEGLQGRWTRVEFDDYDLDDEEEIKLSSDCLAAYIKPSRGGVMYELDLRRIQHNLLATLNRRPEPYHEKVKQAAAMKKQSEGSIEDLSSMVKFKQPDLDKQLNYDTWPRKSLVDHLLLPGANFDQLIEGRARIANLHQKTIRLCHRPGRKRSAGRDDHTDQLDGSSRRLYKVSQNHQRRLGDFAHLVCVRESPSR